MNIKDLEQKILRQFHVYQDYRNRGTLANLVVFCRILKDIGFYITTGMVIDCAKTLSFIDSSRKGDFYIALRANLVSSHEHIKMFDRAFQLFWRTPPEFEEKEEIQTGKDEEEGNDQEEPFSEESLKKDSYLEDWADDSQKKDEPEELSLATYSPVEILAVKDFSNLEADEIPLIKKMISKITPELATRLSRRRKPAVKSHEIDPRRTFRKNIKHGGDIIQFAKRKRKLKKTKIVLICDVSGSMDCYSKFLIQFLYGFQSMERNVETFVFSTRLNRITHILRRRTIEEALSKVSRIVLDWSGGTNIGACLKSFNDGIGRSLLNSKTVLVIISDGWDRGDSERLDIEMEKIRRKARKILWLNPLLGSPNYQPLCKGMKTALPYIDLFLPAHNINSLIYLAKELKKIAI